MIVEEINKIADKKEGREKIKELLDDVGLPIKYHIEETDDSISIVTGKVFKGVVAHLKLNGEIIEVNFLCEDDLEKLRRYFKDSNTKFKLIVGEEGYY